MQFNYIFSILIFKSVIFGRDVTSFAQNADLSPGREREHSTSGFPRELAWASHSRLSETMRRSKQEPFAWARHSSRTWASLRHSRLGETSSLRREWQYSPLFHACSRNTHKGTYQIQTRHFSYHQKPHSAFQKHSANQKPGEIF